MQERYACIGVLMAVIGASRAHDITHPLNALLTRVRWAKDKHSADPAHFS
jgi:hypothetical protein